MNHRELISALTPLHGAGEARAIVRMVMEERFGLSQTDLLLGKDTTLSSSDREDFGKIARRLLAGEPVQYVLGYANFCGHRFHVTPDVLIPRPETSELVQWAISDILHDGSGECPLGFKILDLCTGSGCIAVTLALACPDAHVVAADVSAAALAVARENANEMGATNVGFLQWDILQFPQRETSFGPGEVVDNYDLLISNPPYVRASEAASIHSTVLSHEPSLALFVSDDNPLIFYHSIAQIGLKCLRPRAPVFVEFNAALFSELRMLFDSYGYLDIQIRDDQFGRPRMMRAMRK